MERNGGDIFCATVTICAENSHRYDDFLQFSQKITSVTGQIQKNFDIYVQIGCTTNVFSIEFSETEQI